MFCLLESRDILLERALKFLNGLISEEYLCKMKRLFCLFLITQALVHLLSKLLKSLLFNLFKAETLECL
jgi:hypothetical protein